VGDFARFTKGQIDLIPKVDLFNRCQYGVVLPSGEQVIRDGDLTTGIANYKEFFQSVAGFVGAGQNYTGNGIYTRFQPGGGAFPVHTTESGGARRWGSATVAGGGTRPARGPKPPIKPKAACYKQGAPNLNSATTGPAWGSP
jgi:hypothetical protein